MSTSSKHITVAREEGARASTRLWKLAARQPPSYVYKNIHSDREVRVLKLFPGNRDSLLKCCLLTSPLLDSKGQPFLDTSKEVTYTALSYRWGTDVPSKKLYVFNDEENYKEFKAKSQTMQSFWITRIGFLYIMTNLDNALRQLRSETESVYLWIDALCMNQSNNEERTVQVLHMHEVYMQAQRVCIWLGEGTNKSSQHPFQFLKSILDLDKLEDYEIGFERKDDWSTGAYFEVIMLMQASWFGRRWIIQELMLATNAYVRYGHEEMKWPDFAEAIGLFISIHPNTRWLGPNILVTATDTLFKKSREGRIEQRLGSLEQLVTSVLIPFEASDPKDIIFSVLQIAKDTSTFDDYDEFKHSMLLTLIGLVSHGALLILANITCLRANTLDRRLKTTVAELVSRVRPPLALTLPETGGFIPSISRCLFWLFIFGVGIGWNAWKSWSYLSRVLLKQPLPSRRPKFHDRRIEPDYSKSLLDVWSGFMEYCIETSSSLDVICRRWAPPVSNGENIPSWILSLREQANPTSTSQRTENGMFAWITGKSRIYNASGRSPPSFKFGRRSTVQRAPPVASTPGRYFTRPETKPPWFWRRILQMTVRSPQVISAEDKSQFNGILHVEGIRIESIEKASLIPDGILTHEILNVLGFSKNLTSTDAEFEQVWRTLVAARGPDGSDPPGWYSRACRACIEWYIKDPEDFAKRSTRRTQSGRLTRRVEFMERAQQVAPNRKCFRTRGEDRSLNCVGLAPPNAKPGDFICVLFGCSVPVVLRPAASSSRHVHFTFIGECYVDGLMNGEAVSQKLKQREWFELR